MTTAPDLAEFRAFVARRGGRIITPEENAQPDPALRLAAVVVDGIGGVGPDVAAAAWDWHRQAQLRPRSRRRAA